MEIAHFLFEARRGWSAPLRSELDDTQTLVLAFGSLQGDVLARALSELAQTYPRSTLVGCSSAGEIAGSRVMDDSLSVAVARFRHTTLRRARADITQPQHSAQAGAELARQLCAPDLRAVFVLSDGVKVNGSELIGQLAAGLPETVVITGGLAGDGDRFQHTWLVDGAQAHSGSVCAVGLYGSRLNVGHGCEGGWSGFGPERLITRAEGNVLHELDGQPALDLYKRYLGERASGLPGAALLFPLAIRPRGAASDIVVRTVLGIDEAARSMTFAGDLPVGHTAQLMRANTDRLIDSAGAAGRHAGAGLQEDSAALVISVSCIGRRLVLGERTEEEVESVLDGVRAQGVHVGFYSYGEIAPGSGGRASELHNQTMTVTVLSEA